MTCFNAHSLNYPAFRKGFAMYNFLKIIQTNFMPALNIALIDKLIVVQRVEERPNVRGIPIFITVFNIMPTARYLELDGSDTRVYYAIFIVLLC